jgi:hypothetical protein
LGSSLTSVTFIYPFISSTLQKVNMPVVYPVYSLGYRRPDYVPPTPRSRDSEGSIKSDITGSGMSLKTMPSNPKGVPEALSFDRIVNGGCCPVSA